MSKITVIFLCVVFYLPSIANGEVKSEGRIVLVQVWEAENMILDSWVDDSFKIEEVCDYVVPVCESINFGDYFLNACKDNNNPASLSNEILFPNKLDVDYRILLAGNCLVM